MKVRSSELGNVVTVRKGRGRKIQANEIVYGKTQRLGLREPGRKWRNLTVDKDAGSGPLGPGFWSLS